VSGDVPELFTAKEHHSTQQLKVKREKNIPQKSRPKQQKQEYFLNQKSGFCHMGGKRQTADLNICLHGVCALRSLGKVSFISLGLHSTPDLEIGTCTMVLFSNTNR